jgi:hypothetical protein
MKKITGIILTLILSCATFVSAQVNIKGANGIDPSTSYTTLKAAFDAINSNASGLATDVINIEVSANTTETNVQATLNAPKGISSITLTPGATTYKLPVITLTGNNTGGNGTFNVTIYNGKVHSITNTGGTWSAVPTITIEGSGGPSGLNVTTQATATCTKNTTGNLTFFITNGGAGYGPTTTVTPTSDGSGAALGLVLTSALTVSGSGPYTLTPSAVAVAGNYLDKAGSGYTTGATAPATNTLGGTFASGTAATASYAIGISNANYASVKIYPTASNVVINASNTAAVSFLTLNGAKNVTIDGRVHTEGVPAGAADLTIQYNCSAAGTNLASAIFLNAGANNNAIKYCKLKSNAQNGAVHGILAIGTFSLATGVGTSSVGGSNNTISYNAFSSYNTNGVGSMITSASCNDDFPNTYNIIDNNTFDNYLTIANAGALQGAIYLFGNQNPNKPNHSNYTISNNSFFNSAALATTANKTRMFIKVGNATEFTYGGFGHTISGNYIGGTAALCTGGKLTKTGAFADNLTFIYLNSSNGTATTIQNNVFKNISITNGGGGTTTNSTKFIDVNGPGPATISGNTIGDNTVGSDPATASIIFDNAALGGTSTLYCIQNNATGDVTCENNSIGSILLKTGSKTNFAGIWKTGTAGNFTISNNIVGNASTANSILNNSASTYWTYGISSAGTGTINVNGNTIANISSSTTTDKLYGINHDSGASTFNANANLIHSLNVYATSTAAKIVGVYCARGTNTITNNIIKLNGDNPATIYGLNEEENASTASSFYHNTVYISGAPATLALNSACMASNGTSTTRNIKNNIFVNARTNNGATGTHYALLMPATTGTIAVDANDYQATGASGAMLGNYGGTPVSSGSVIVTDQDVNSQNVDPGFASVGGTLAINYMTGTTLTGVNIGVTKDYSGADRLSIQMGAWDKSLGTATNNLVEDDGIIVTRRNNQLIISCNNELKNNASVSVYNLMGKKITSIQLINATTVLDNTFQSGIYLVTVINGGKTITKKTIFN